MLKQQTNQSGELTSRYYVGGTAKHNTQPFTHVAIGIPLEDIEAMVELAKEVGNTWINLQVSQSKTPYVKDGKTLSTHSVTFDNWSKSTVPEGNSKPPVDTNATDDLPF